jgi:hypothetical protein
MARQDIPFFSALIGGGVFIGYQWVKNQAHADGKPTDMRDEFEIIFTTP